MKKFRLLSVVLVMFSVLSLTSCDTEPVDPVLNNGGNGNGDGDGGTGPGTTTGVFKVDHSGSTHTASKVLSSVGDDLIQIAAEFPDGSSIGIGIEGNAVGTYTNDKLIMGYNAPNDETSYVNFSSEEVSGKVTITSINMETKTMSGTFSFTGWYGDEEANLPAKLFTNGTFDNIPFTNEGSGGVDENQFKATIDGTVVDYVDDIVGATFGEGETIQYIGLTAVGEYGISIQTDIDVTPGTYQFTGNILNGTPLATFTAPDGTDYPITGGTLTVSSNTDDHIVGTFKFTVKNGSGATIHTVTNGSFDVFY